MIQLLISKIRLPSLLATVKRSTTLINSTIRRNVTELASTKGKEELAKDIIVYKYENPRKFRLLNIFAMSQLVFWWYIGSWSYSGMKDTKIDETQVDDDTPWFRKVNLGESKYKNTLAATCFILGYLGIFCGWTYTLRSVRFLIMRKDGKSVAFVTYTPFGQNRIMNVPLHCISAQESRSTAKSFLPLKVKNRSFYYILDMSGEFKNTRLYDSVIGLRRNL